MCYICNQVYSLSLSLFSDGQGRTGAFMCLHAQQDRIKAEGVLDVFHFIKSSRIQRYRLVSDLVRYIGHDEHTIISLTSLSTGTVHFLSPSSTRIL